MNTILLVTIHDYKNLGNRLQNYALQSVLEQMGFEVDNLSVQIVPRDTIKRKIKTTIEHILVCFGNKRYKTIIAELSLQDKCVKFTDKYIHNLLYKDRECLKCVDWKEYAYAVCGSDQIWHNWHHIEDELSFYYLDFIDPSKRVSYAPSFGFDSFPDDDIDLHKKGLIGMAALSCREQEGCRLINQLTGRDAIKVLDPTLLLDVSKWEQVETRPSFDREERYLLQFMLGNVSSEYRKEIEDIADKRHLQILDVHDPQEPIQYGISPSDFIWLIHHADVVCTDSFHASVISILFGKNLRVFERISPQYGNMFGRLRDLLEPLGLMGNVFRVGDNLSTLLSGEAKEYLARERKRSMQYLNNSLAITEN